MMTATVKMAAADAMTAGGEETVTAGMTAVMAETIATIETAETTETAETMGTIEMNETAEAMIMTEGIAAVPTEIATTAGMVIVITIMAQSLTSEKAATTEMTGTPEMSVAGRIGKVAQKATDLVVDYPMIGVIGNGEVVSIYLNLGKLIQVNFLCHISPIPCYTRIILNFYLMCWFLLYYTFIIVLTTMSSPNVIAFILFLHSQISFYQIGNLRI